jgi:hypothetical protein
MLSILAAIVMTTACGKDFSRELAALRSGETKVARAEWWGFNEKDCTKQLQAALDSGAGKLIVSKQKSPWIVSKTLHLRSNMEIVFEEGAEILAAKGAFKRNVEQLFKARSVKNIIMRGKGIIKMRHDDYMDRTKYKRGQHRHTLGLYSSTDITVKDLTIIGSGGDGIYVNNIKNLVVDGVVLDYHVRQGISVINGENILIKNSVIKNTRGEAPECGIDFEPNNANEKLKNCRVINTRFENNYYAAININLTQLNNKSEDIDILIRDCTFSGGLYGINFWQMKSQTSARGTIKYENCTITAPRRNAIHVDSFRGNGPKVTLKNMNITSSSSSSVINFYIRDFVKTAVGNFSFINCHVNSKGRILDVINYSKKAYLKVSGEVLVNNEKIDLSQYIKKHAFDKNISNLKTGTLQNLQSLRLFASNPEVGSKKSAIALRGQSQLLLAAKKGDKVKIDYKYIRLGRYKTPDIVLKLRGPDNKERLLTTLKYKDGNQQTVEFTAEQSGNYLIKMTKFINCLRIENISVPWAVFTRPLKGLYQLFAFRGNLYFAAPANCDRLYFVADGAGSALDIDVFMENKKIAEAKNVLRRKVFVIDIEKSDKARPVKLAVKSTTGCSLLFSEPVLPLFSNSPSNLFEQK